jgi:hypothetical protein
VEKPLAKKQASHGCISYMAVVYLTQVIEKGGTETDLRAYLVWSR